MWELFPRDRGQETNILCSQKDMDTDRQRNRKQRICQLMEGFKEKAKPDIPTSSMRKQSSEGERAQDHM